MAKSLIIVESPAKTKSIKAYLGSDYDVEASVGHIRDLPKSWNPTSIDTPFDVPYEVTKDRLETVKKLRAAAKKVDMIYLALITDSTRSISLMTFGMHHDLSHHGKEPKKLAQCRQVEVELIQAFGGLLDKLKAAKEGGTSLLDSTMMLMTSNLRDGNTHWTYNLPTILAGGGFRHGQHLAFNKPYLEQVNQELNPTPAAKSNPEKKIPPHGSRSSTTLQSIYIHAEKGRG